MISINLNMLILRPIWVVFDFIAAPENNSQWQYGSLKSVQTSEGGMKIGTLFVSFGHFMGRRIQSTFEVTDFESNKKYGFKTISGPIQLQTTYQFENINHNTNLLLSTQINPGSFFKLVDAIVKRVAKQQFQENLLTLKELLESKAENPKRD